MPKITVRAAPIGPDPKGWPDIRSAWSRHQVANQGKNDMESLREFLVTTLATLKSKPGQLSSQAYARFFDTMSALVPWKKLSTYMQEVRVPLMISLGILAQHSAEEKSHTGRGVESQYMAQMKHAFENMMFISSVDKHMYEDVFLLLQSDLLPIFKLRVLRDFTFPVLWLRPEMVPHIQLLLPAPEKEAFKFFAWDAKNPDSNKELVRVFLPTVYTLLDLSLSASAWTSWATIAKALKDLAPSRKNKERSIALELPSDCFD